MTNTIVFDRYHTTKRIPTSFLFPFCQTYFFCLRVSIHIESSKCSTWSTNVNCFSSLILMIDFRHRSTIENLPDQLFNRFRPNLENYSSMLFQTISSILMLIGGKNELWIIFHKFEQILVEIRWIFWSWTISSWILRMKFNDFVFVILDQSKVVFRKKWIVKIILLLSRWHWKEAFYPFEKILLSTRHMFWFWEITSLDDLTHMCPYPLDCIAMNYKMMVIWNA